MCRPKKEYYNPLCTYVTPLTESNPFCHYARGQDDGRFPKCTGHHQGVRRPEAEGLSVYVPTACETQTCRVHVVFHGCKQYAENAQVGDAVYKHGGYNEWADTNKIIVLYPRTVAVPLKNPNGCWDFWGFDDGLPHNREFARKIGYQISAIKKMLDRLAEGPTHGGGSSDTFGTPHHFEATDTTSDSVELVWP